MKLFNGYAGWTGTMYTNSDSAINVSARPGHSEHQLGLTIDFVAVGDDGLSASWEATATGGWMAMNAWEYGWPMGYPKGKQALTCHSYEPWHYRYVGRDLAKKIHDSGLTVREYLWTNYLQVDPTCAALPAPSLGGPARSCPLPTPSPTAAPTAAPTPVPATPTPATPAPAQPSMVATPLPAPSGAPRRDLSRFGRLPLLRLSLDYW